MPRTKASLLILAATAAAVATLLLLPFTPKIPVRTALVQSGDWLLTLQLDGTVRCLHEQTCVALYAAAVNGVYVQPGQNVSRGDLLFSLDTSAQEALLAQLTQNRYALQDAPWLAAASSAAQTEGELRSQIEAGKIRAQADGRVSAVYVQEGDQLAAASLLGVVSSTQKCVVAAARVQQAQNLPQQAAATLSLPSGHVPASLSRISAPIQSEIQIVQQLTFLPADEKMLDDAALGDNIQVEVLLKRKKNAALVPISAVDSENQVWLVEDGKATPCKIEVTERNDRYVACGLEMTGKRLIVQPEKYALWPNCPVKEAPNR